jgi:hypothetical protein
MPTQFIYITTVTGQSVTGGLLFLACNWRSGNSAVFCMIMTNILQPDCLPSVGDDRLICRLAITTTHNVPDMSTVER